MKAQEEIERLQAKLDCGDLPPDEPLFVLRARDRLAAGCVRAWISACDKIGGVPTPKTTEVAMLANAMDDWPVKQTPGRPDTQIIG